MLTLLYLFIILVAFAAVLNKDKSKYAQSFYFLIAAFLVVYAAFRDGNTIRDYNEYLKYYENYQEVLVEPSFYIICSVVHYILNNPIGIFIIYALLGVLLKFLAIRQLTDLVLLSVLVYVSHYFVLHEMTQMRVGVASGMLLLCIKPMYERNLKRFLLFASIAVFFHVSALFIVLVWFLNPLKINYFLYVLLIPVSYIMYLAGMNLIYVIPIPYIQEKMNIYQQITETQEINLFNSIHLLKCLLLYYFLYFADRLKEYNKYTIILIKLYAISLSSFILFSALPALSFRISEFVGVVEIILIPLMYYTMRPKIFPKLFILLIVLVFCYTTIVYGKLITV